MSVAMIIFGALTVLTSAAVVFTGKTLHSALFLVLTSFLFAAHYALLGADFIAALQILIYSGAIMVLVVFVILLLGLNEQASRWRGAFSLLAPGLLVCTFLLLLVVSASFRAEDMLQPAGAAHPEAMTPGGVGRALLSVYLYPFEVTSVLLLAAIIGSVVIAYEPKRPLAAGRGLRAMREKQQDVSVSGGLPLDPAQRQRVP